MYSPIQRSSFLFLSAQLRRLSASEQPCLVSLLQQTVLSPPNPRCKSSSSASDAFKNAGKNQNKVLPSTSAPADAQARQGDAQRRPLPPYMVFRACSQTGPGIHQSTATHSTLGLEITSQETVEVPQVETIASRPLVLLFAWMLSTNSHLEKYREFWLSRGYDILTVQTSPIDLLIPPIGSQKVASNVFKFLSQISPQYDQVLVHAFSVGGYQFSELLQRLKEGLERGEEESERVYSSIKGILIDSMAYADDVPPGLSKAITRHRIGQPLLEKSIAGFLKATKPITADRYKLVENAFLENGRAIPSMMLFSRDDVVSSWRRNLATVDAWKAKGIEAEATCWETSKHVLHYKEHPAEYQKAVDSFVKKMHITKAYRRE